MTVFPSARALNVFFAVALAYIAGANHDLVRARLGEAAAVARSAQVALPAECCPAGSCTPACSCPSQPPVAKKSRPAVTDQWSGCPCLFPSCRCYEGEVCGCGGSAGGGCYCGDHCPGRK